MELSDSVKQYLEQLISEQTATLSSKISALELQLQEKDKKIDEIAGSLAVVRNVNAQLQKTIDTMQVEIDDNGQYSRRYSIRIENIPYARDETEDQLKAKVVDVLSKTGVDVKDDTLCRWHRSGKPRPKRHADRRASTAPAEMVAQTIVKFRHWQPRKQAYAGRKNLRGTDFKIRPDLTKRRLDLLNTARDRVKALGVNTNDNFAYADTNCNLAVRLNGERRFFNTRRELEAIIDDYWRSNRIVNLQTMTSTEREHWLQDRENNVFVGRPSRYGNPYKVGTYSREEAVSNYKSFTLQTLTHEEINYLRNKQLGCFCHPKLCHADLLIEALGY